MVVPRQLVRPPITEALIDLRILPSHPVTAEMLQPLRAELAESFPKSGEQKHFTAEFRVEAGKLVPPSARDLGFRGLRLSSADGSRAVQFRTDGFTFNNVGLGAYMGGEALLDEALRLWSPFTDVIRPATVTRVALRYLNRLELPLRDGDDFTRFLTAPPTVPEEAPQRVSSFLSRVVTHDDTGAIAIVTQKLDRPSPGDAIAVVIDIDVFFSEELSLVPEQIRPRLELLRAIKNRVFFALLSEEAVRLYT